MYENVNIFILNRPDAARAPLLTVLSVCNDEIPKFKLVG